MNMNKTIPAILIIVVVVVGAYFIFKGNASNNAQPAAVGGALKGTKGGGGKTVTKGCTQANPTVVITAPAVTTVKSGGTLIYQVSTTNNDSTGCGSSYFNVLPFRTATDYGWFYGTAASTTVAPGATATVSVSITPPAGTIPGNQSFVYRATNNANPVYWANSAPSMLTVQ